MRDINELIGKSGPFTFPNGDVIEGTLLFDKDNNKRIVLYSRINRIQYKKYEGEELQLTGKVYGTDITLIRVIIISTTTAGLLDGDEDNSIHTEFMPTVIILNKKYNDSILVNEIDACAKKVEKFLPIRTVWDFMEEGKYNPHIRIVDEPELYAKDKTGSIRVYSRLSLGEKDYLPYFKRSVRFGYCFNSAVELTKAYKEIYYCRNLFSFFMDDYLEIDDLVFLDSENEKCVLIDNYNGAFSSQKEFSILSLNNIECDFQTIWERWKLFLEKNEETTMLFYEILCDNSVRINRFLNLCQIVEIISCNERDKEAIIIKEECKNTFDKEYLEKHPRVKYKLLLKHRILDAIRYSNVLIKKKNNGVDYYIASEIADLRNYYTHYDKKRLKIERNESINHIYYYSLFLRVVILKMIYNYLGIPVADLILPVDYKHAIEATYKIGKRKLESELNCKEDIE